MRSNLQKSTANLTPALEGVCRNSKSFRRWFGGQPQFRFHAPTSVSGDVLSAVQLAAVGLFTSFYALDVVITLGPKLLTGQAS